MEKFKEFLKRLQDSGLPLIWITDPLRKTPSVSLTMLILSFSLTLIGIVGKIGNMVDINVDQSKELLFAMSLLYFGRSVAGKNTTVVEATKQKEE